MYMFIKI